MKITRNSKETILRISASVKIKELQLIYDKVRLKEITSRSKATKKDVDELVTFVKSKRVVKIARK